MRNNYHIFIKLGCSNLARKLNTKILLSQVAKDLRKDTSKANLLVRTTWQKEPDPTLSLLDFMTLNFELRTLAKENVPS